MHKKKTKLETWLLSFAITLIRIFLVIHPTPYFWYVRILITFIFGIFSLFSTDAALSGDVNLAPSTNVKNLGVSSDQDLSLDAHVKHISRSAIYHLRNIAKVQHLLS